MKQKILSFLLCAVYILTFVSCNAMENSVECVHNLGVISATGATCTKAGNVKYYSCILCGDLYADKEGNTKISKEVTIVPAKGHSPVKVSAKEATCTAQGNIEYYSCEGCNEWFYDETCTAPVAKNDTKLERMHKPLIHHGQINAVGNENGNIEYWECDGCGKLFEDENAKAEISIEETILYAPLQTPDFLVEVEENRNPIVLQLSDTQIIDASQQRYPNRLSGMEGYWAKDKLEDRCYKFLREMFQEIQPDLIILTGDIIYGEFDDNGSVLLNFIDFMESFKIPWAPVFGNHDNESKKGVDWQCAQFEDAKYCLFEQKTLTGNGNYSVGIVQGNTLKRVFYMMDSNGCSSASAESLANGHTTTKTGFGKDQIEWYTRQISQLKIASPTTKISFAFHIQPYIFAKAYEKYGFKNSGDKINIYTHADKEPQDFGYIGSALKGPWDASYTVYNGMKDLGVDSIFVGHEHLNCVSVVYEGIRFQFGQKSSEYDRFNCVNKDGSISGGYGPTGNTLQSLIGGTVIPLSKENGEIQQPYIYLCSTAGGNIDWNQWS